jgi:hypothetical protein
MTLTLGGDTAETCCAVRLRGMAMISETNQPSQDPRKSAHRIVTIIRKDGSRQRILFDRSRQLRASYLMEQANARTAGK